VAAFEVVTADVLEWAAAYDGPLFHSLLCDPPYHFVSIAKRFGKPGSAPAQHGHDGAFARASAGFMGQIWDGGDIAFRPETWAAFLPLLHPGAFGMAFASARGWHRLAVAIEDAGFIIHPSIFAWAHGQGFPKATRIDTQIDREAGAERETRQAQGPIAHEHSDGWVGNPAIESLPATDLAKTWEHHRYGLQAMKPAIEPIILFQKPYEARPVDDITRTGAGALNIGAGRLAFQSRADEATSHPSGQATSEPGSFGGSVGAERSAFQPSRGRAGEASAPPGPPGGAETGRWPPNFALVHTPECKKVARKRVETGMASGGGASGTNAVYGRMKPRKEGQPDEGYADPDGMETVDVWECAPGCPVAELDAQAGERSSGNGPVNRQQDGGYNKDWPMGMQAAVYGDVGPASRFYPTFDWAQEIAEGLFESNPAHFEAKADVEERERGLRFVVPCAMAGKPGVVHERDPLESVTHIVIRKDGTKMEVNCRRNLHPTIKPIALIRWLARLLLPPEAYMPRRVLVPFSGAGSEVIAARLEQWDEVIGVELHEEYATLARHRMRAYLGML